jgi:hypothetical protein
MNCFDDGVGRHDKLAVWWRGEDRGVVGQVQGAFARQRRKMGGDDGEFFGKFGHQRIFPAKSRIFERAHDIKVFWFFSSEKNILALPFLGLRKALFFSEEKNEKTFASCAGSTIRDLAGA